MKSLSRLFFVALVALFATLATPVTAHAQDNIAVAVNTKDGKSVFKLAFSVKKVSGDVDSTNAAVAYASCTECKTVAAAIQVVLVSGDVDSATPQNLAIAINYDCTECETLAAAFQFVYGDGQELQFTDAGKARLRELKKQFHDLKHREDLTLAELAVEIARIAAEVQLVVETETEVKKAKEQATTTSTTAGTSTTTTVAGSPSTPSASTTTTGTPATTTTSASSTTTTSPTSTIAVTTTTATP